MTTTTPDSSGMWARLAAASQAMMSYRRSAQVGRAMRGGAWTMVGYGVQTALRFISRIVVAKLLIDPAPLGTVVLITTILSGLEMLSDLGINVNIVQHKDGAGARFLGTARSVQFLRSVGIFLIAVLLALPISWIYKDGELAPLLLVAALSVLFRGLVNPGMSVLVRQVDLRRPALVAILTEVVGFLVTVVWALAAPSAWALVVGSVAGAATTALASQFAGGRVRFAWNSAYARQIVGFGGWIILSTGTYFLSSRGEVLLLKGSVPDVEFGCFAFASMLVATPLAAIMQLGSQVLLPFLAGWLREGENTATQQFRRVKWLFTVLAIAFAWGAILLSPMLIGLLNLNRSYASLTWMVQFLGVRAAFDVFALPVSNSLLAAGASRYSAVANTVRLIVLVSGLYLTVKVYELGLEGAIWVLIGGPVLAYTTLLPGVARHLRGVMTTEAATTAVFAGSTALAAALALVMTGGGAMH